MCLVLGWKVWVWDVLCSMVCDEDGRCGVCVLWAVFSVVCNVAEVINMVHRGCVLSYSISSTVWHIGGGSFWCIGMV